jgi:hypothetical protein
MMQTSWASKRAQDITVYWKQFSSLFLFFIFQLRKNSKNFFPLSKFEEFEKRYFLPLNFTGPVKTSPVNHLFIIAFEKHK